MTISSTSRALISALLFFLTSAPSAHAACTEARVFEVEKTLNEKSAILIDVRKPFEYKDCHLPDSVNLPLGELSSGMKKLNKEQTVIVYCTTGQRSSEACMFLKTSGFKNVFNMTGGIRAWYNTGRKLEGDCKGAPYFFYDSKGNVLKPEGGNVPEEPDIKGCK